MTVVFRCYKGVESIGGFSEKSRRLTVFWIFFMDRLSFTSWNQAWWGVRQKQHRIFTRYPQHRERLFSLQIQPDLPKFSGHQGIGVISDTDAQPLIIGSHLGTFGIVTVGKINNLEHLGKQAYGKRLHFSEMSGGEMHPTELVAMLICEGESFIDGICKAQASIDGSCSMLLLTENGIYAARDRLGRTPVIIGKKTGAYAGHPSHARFPTWNSRSIDIWVQGKLFA